MRPRPDPQWYPAIQHKLKTHIQCLVARYRISSHSVEDIFNEVVANMVKAERNGSTIQFPPAYAEKAAQNLVLKIQKHEYRERGLELILQGNLFDELHADTATSCDQAWEDRDPLCTIIHNFRDQYPRHHQFIILRDLEQLEYEKISRLLEMSQDAVRQAYSRARKEFLEFARAYASKSFN